MFGKQQTGSFFGTAPALSSSTGGFQFGTPAAGTASAGLVGGGGASGFQFGATVNNPSTTSGFSLGSAGTLFTSTTLSSATGTTPSLGFGTAPSVVRPMMSFGQTGVASSNLGGTTTGLFGGLGTAATTASTGGFGFTATPASNPLGAQTTGFGGFGLGTTPAPLSLGGFGGTGMATATPSLELGSSLSSFQTPTSSLGLGLGSFGTGLGSTTAAIPSMGLGLLGAAPTPALTSTTASAFGLGGIQSTTATVTGLGGIGLSTAQTDGAKSDSKTLKEYPVPPEITNLTEDFKKYLKEQKSTREEISRVSSKSLFKVEEETASLKQLLSVVSNGIQRNTASIRQLKQETAQELKNVEVMQRTKDIPLALQYENTAPMEFFNQLIATFEMKMKTYRQQIEVMEQHLSSVTQPSAFTPQELMNTIRKLYETFVYLASELQTIHEALETQKDRYVTYRRLVHGENVNVFESRTKGLTAIGKSSRTPVTLGPSPFANVQTSTAAIFASALERAQQPGGVPPTASLSSSSLNTIASGLGMSALQSGGFQSNSNIMAVKPLVLTGASTAPVGSASYGGFGTGLQYTAPATPVFGVANKPFQLQKPPVGNKRGKR